MVAVVPEITLLIVSEPPLMTFIECEVLPKPTAKLMVSKLGELSTNPAVVVIELPVSVKAPAVLLKNSPANEKLVSLLLAVNRVEPSK